MDLGGLAGWPQWQANAVMTNGFGSASDNAPVSTFPGGQPDLLLSPEQVRVLQQEFVRTQLVIDQQQQQQQPQQQHLAHNTQQQEQQLVDLLGACNHCKQSL